MHGEKAGRRARLASPFAARIIADQITHQDNRWAGLYKATRFTPVKSARTLGEKTAAVVKVVVQDDLTQRQHEQLGNVRSGDAAIVEAVLEGRAIEPLGRKALPAGQR